MSKGPKQTAHPAVPSMPKRVSIEKVANGFTVSKYNDMGRDKVHIAKTHSEAMKLTKKLLK